MTSLNKLIKTVETLRSPEGCPWDKEQTFSSLIPCILEECYELVDAIEKKDTENIIEECGDVLLQIIMIATIATETQLFSLDTIADTVNTKMIRRHPHVFGDKKLDTSDEVLNQWEAIKKKEHSSTSIMDPLPQLPALQKAEKIQKRAAKQGFDWNTSQEAFEKVTEELAEFQTELTKSANHQLREEEAGDLLFAIVNVLRKESINPETALRKANEKFIKRYQAMEKLNDEFGTLPLEEKEKLWKQAKQLTQPK